MFVFAYDNIEGNNQVSINPSQKFFLPRAKIENCNIEIVEEAFMISQLLTRLSNTTKSEKYQQDKVMITQLVVY